MIVKIYKQRKEFCDMDIQETRKLTVPKIRRYLDVMDVRLTSKQCCVLTGILRTTIKTTTHLFKKTNIFLDSLQRF